MNKLGAVSGLSQGGLYTQTLGHDEHGPVVFSKERTESLFNSGEITKEQYDKAMKQHEIHESKIEKMKEEVEAKKAEEKSKAEEKDKDSKWNPFTGFLSSIIDGSILDIFKTPKGKEKETMDNTTAQWCYDNPI